MKQLIVFILVIFVNLKISYGTCSIGEVKVYPHDLYAPQNSIFIIEGYGDAQKIVEDISSHKIKIFLTSDDDIVPLRVTEWHQGQFNISQVVLRPERILKAGAVYKTKFIGLAKEQEIYFNRSIENLFWNIIEQDNITPVLYDVAFESNSYIEYGCGPEAYINLKCSTDESSQAVSFFIVTLADSVNVSTYIIPGQYSLSVGHDMCSGPFVLQEGIDYNITVQAMDISGNLSVGKQALIVNWPRKFDR